MFKVKKFMFASMLTINISLFFNVSMVEGQWEIIRNPEFDYVLESVYFVDLNNGWAVGTNGTIIKTDNGGTTWTPQASGITEDLSSIHFLNLTDGWIVGDNGVILRTVNGGTYWEAVANSTSNHLHDIYFVDNNNGWIVGGTATVNFSSTYGFSNLRHTNVILHTNDGGSSWFDITDQGNKRILKSIHFPNSNHGFAVGYGYYLAGPWEIQDRNIVISSSDGVSWSSQSPGVYDHLFDVFAIDQDNVWIVGDNGIVLHTTNGGFDWNQVDINTSNSLSALFFVNSERGWIVGEGGLILYTQDGGSTFIPQDIGIDEKLNSIYFYGQDNGWAVGSNGIVIKYTSSTDVDEVFTNNLLNEFSLMQNYPNPFNPKTNIEFELPNTKDVTLKIFNILGEEVATLVSDRLSAGSYTYEWDARNHTSGIYLYKLEADGFAEVKRMVLMK